MGIYDDRIANSLRNIESHIRNAKYPEENRQLLIDFEMHLFGEGLSQSRILKLLIMMNTISRIATDILDDKKKIFYEMLQMDVQAIVVNLERSSRFPSTKNDYKIALKKFFSWMEWAGYHPVDISWIKTGIKISDSKIPEELLNTDEVKLMIDKTDSSRDKAILAVLYDAGCRIGELGGLKIKNITFDQYGGIMVVRGKTGMRRVRIIFSSPYLAAWLDVHPDKDNPNAYVFVNLRGKGYGKKQIQYENYTKIIFNAAKKAGIKKRVHAHLFRHSRSTELAEYLTESQMEEHLGWIQGSRMPRIYVHMSGKRIDETILAIHGIKDQERKETTLKSQVCGRCGNINGPTSKFCSKCGLALDFETITKIDNEKERLLKELMKMIAKNPEISKIMENLDEMNG